MIYIALTLFGLLCYVVARRKARERSQWLVRYRGYVPRRERDAWFV
jgi:hypothetical protein